ncbi:L,D-transpeptidase [Promicromonospora kroppenstedtii]|uniref:L,D-transpeptidase n=1 Tax=Promicromonospora kroppenstedtii TaxID=440482 RepID=A0ABW7XKQ3_9MICO
MTTRYRRWLLRAAAAQGTMDPTSGPGRGQRRRTGENEQMTQSRRTWIWVAAVALVAIVGTAVWLGLRGPAETADAAPSASPSPSASPTPVKATPQAAGYSLAALPTPDIDGLLPAQLPHTTLDSLEDLPGAVAEPRKGKVPVWAEPDTTVPPVLALEADYYDADARWLVLERETDWVKVLIPYGRGALPSDDPDKVNGVSGWLRASDVVEEREQRSVVVDLSDRTVTLTHADGTQDELPAAVGAAETPTPLGLTQVFTVTEAVNTGMSVFLSMQSESLDGFYGTDYAATALHVGEGQGQAVSNGCVRLTSADFEHLTDLEPGVPVLIKA